MINFIEYLEKIEERKEKVKIEYIVEYICRYAKPV